MLTEKDFNNTNPSSGWTVYVEVLEYDSTEPISGSICPGYEEWAEPWSGQRGGWYYRSEQKELPPERVIRFSSLPGDASRNWKMGQQIIVTVREGRKRLDQYVVSGNGEEIRAFSIRFSSYARVAACDRENDKMAYHTPPAITDYKFIYCGEEIPKGYIACKDKEGCYRPCIQKIEMQSRMSEIRRLIRGN
jgi:hypothetical protein